MHVTFGDEGSSFVLLILSLRMKIGWLARESRDLVALVLLLRGNIIRGGANSSIVVVGVVLMGLDLGITSRFFILLFVKREKERSWRWRWCV
ncbi:hypothetical protein HanRHA438_Chr01g0040921 [Helianthus annuus]|nr:hypothetical protein HanRHA438_Chr01g0040921 [Helianthus annuus]